MNNSADSKPSKGEIPFWYRINGTIVLVFSGVLAYKLIVTPLDFSKLDFPNLLSLLLAFFSIGLSATFYFKATDTSNAFYDNSYNFTKEIAQILVRMESVFAERLKHLDETQSRMQDYLTSTDSPKEESEAQNQLMLEKEEAQKIVEEKNKIISELLEKTDLDAKTKDNFIEELNERDMSLQNAQHEIAELRSRLKVIQNPEAFPTSRINRVKRYVAQNVLGEFDIKDFRLASRNLINKYWSGFYKTLPGGLINDLYELGLIDKNELWTVEGVNFLRNLDERNLDEVEMKNRRNWVNSKGDKSISDE